MNFDEIMAMIGSGSGDQGVSGPTAEAGAGSDNQLFGAGNMRHQRGPLDATYQNAPGELSHSGGQYGYTKGAPLAQADTGAGAQGNKYQQLQQMLGAAAQAQAAQKKDEKKDEKPKKGEFKAMGQMESAPTSAPVIAFNTPQGNPLLQPQVVDSAQPIPDTSLDQPYQRKKPWSY